MMDGLPKSAGRAEPLEGTRPGSFAMALRERTAQLHAHAERSGIMRDILRGRATRRGYALMLRNLQPAYEAMEQGLERRRNDPAVGRFAWRELYRTGALCADLAALCGDDWSRALPLLAAGRKYARRVADVAQGGGARLIAHAYVRYLGDLSGGQVMKKLLGESLGLEDRELSFYAFPRITDHGAFKDEFRLALDDVGTTLADADAVIEEATVAFELNIDVSNAVLAAAGGPRAIS
jgi:heme oxygenase